MFSCMRNPVTNRTSLHLVSDKKLAKTSAKSYDKIISQSTLSSNSANTAMVKKVGTRISRAVDSYLRSKHKNTEADQFKWEFNLIQDSIANAWCMPGGKVVVYTGILPITQDENGMAVVLGHEISHAVASHANRRISQNKLIKIGGYTLQVLTFGQGYIVQALFSTAYSAGTSVGILLPFSRKDEYEADRMGMIFMAMAGYDPHYAIDFWERMETMTKSKRKNSYLSTHPGHKNRIKRLREELPEAMKYYKRRIN